MINNFGCIDHKEVVFGEKKTYIGGSNGVGKSTVKKALLWVLGFKDENGKEISDYRPCNADGIKNENDISVALVFDDCTIKKVSVREYTKQGEFKGNKVLCFKDDFPISTADYSAFIAECIPEECCINARRFLALDASGRRERLFRSFGTTELPTGDEYADIVPILEKSTVDAAIKKYREMLRGTKYERGLEKKLEMTNACIDELEHSERSTVDIEAIEKKKATILSAIEKNKQKADELKKRGDAFEGIATTVMQLQFELGDIVSMHSAKIADQKRAIFEQISEANERELKIKGAIKEAECVLVECEAKTAKLMARAAELREDNDNASQLCASDDDLICPVCKREYDEDKKHQIRIEFEQKKRERLFAAYDELEAITREAVEVCAKAKHTRKLLNELNADLTYNTEVIDKLSMTEVDSTPVEETDVYKKKLEEINANKGQVAELNEIEGQMSKLSLERAEMNEELAEIEKELARAKARESIDNRILELKETRKETVKNIADCNRILLALQKYKTECARILEREVNKHFNIVRFSLFKEQTNGELKDICTPCVNGISYDTNLNFAHRILAEMDICSTFQRAHGITLPLIIDEASSIDPWRLDGFEQQLIIIARSDDNELTIKKED